MSSPGVSRRALLVGGGALWLAGCAKAKPEQRGQRVAATSRTATTTRRATTARVVAATGSFAALEKQFDARLGVWALDTANSWRVEHRADERFAFCSTHKAFSAAAVLKHNDIAALEKVVPYGAADIARFSPITAQHVGSGMTLRALCDAAVRFSDNTAANLLFRELGGPPELQSYLRSLRDTVTNVSRTEPALSTAIPGDVRDTTTPRAWGADLQQVCLGDALPSAKRAILVDWLVRNVTGGRLIRAATPKGWKVGDKTGNGGYGARNDIAVLWPPGADPIVLVVMSSRPNQSDAYDDHLIAAAAKVALGALRH